MRKHLIILALFAALLPASGGYKTLNDLSYYDADFPRRGDAAYLAERCRLDLCCPEHRKGFSTVVVFHGGGLIRGGKNLYPALLMRGFAVAAVNYRFSGKQAKCPDYLYDAAAAVYEALKRSYDAVIMSLSGMAVLMDAMSAAMCAVYGLTGNVAGGSASVTTLMFVLQAVRLVSDKILLPLIFACFGCSVLSASGFGDGLSGIPATVKRAVTFLCGASAAVVCAVLSYQTVIAKAADSAVLKTVKFASSSFLPIVGSSLSESVNAVSSAIGAIKTASGVGGVISLVVLTVPAAVSVASSVFCVKLCSFLCGILQTEKLKAFFDDCGELLSMLLAVQLTVSVIFAASCALFCI